MNSNMTPKEWLRNKSRTYQDGIDIYNLYKKDGNYDAYFAQVKNAPVTSLHFKLLMQQIIRIDRILDANPSMVKNVVPKKETQKPDQVSNKAHNDAPITVEKLNFNKTKIDRVIENKNYNYHMMPDDIQNKYDRIKSIGREATALHAKLKVSNLSDNDRKQIAQEIVLLEDERNQKWQEVDVWANTPASQRENANIAEVTKKINAAKKYLDRNFNSKVPETIAKVTERLEYLKSCSIDYIPKSAK